MQDVEYVLRFFTIDQYWRAFNGDFRKSMNTYMGEHRDADEKFIKAREAEYVQAITACNRIFSSNAFQRFERGQWRNQTLGALYDAQMVAINTFSKPQIDAMIKNRVQLVKRYKTLFADDQFNTAIRTATNTPTRLEYRIEQTIDCLAEFAPKR
jgi:2-keto-3-deoxy-galactonokinase